MTDLRTHDARRRLRRLGRIVRAPALYVAWALAVVAVLVVAYNVDPYAFGFASLGLAWATGLVAIVGLVAVVLARAASWRAKLVVSVAMLIASVAVAVSLHLLEGFKWA